MCGIAGFWGESTTRDEASHVARRMALAIAHRGPDDAGCWVDERAEVALGHRRLSIVDLSPLGHQPMTSESGRYVICFNGEVYNFRRLRDALARSDAPPNFRGGSDTEVMLAAIEAWGLEAAVRRFVGMFAFALWDRRERALHLVRDRLGVKPLYYGWSGGTLLFGSELRAITTHPDFRGEIDRGAVALLMRHGCVPAPYCIFRGLRKLPPGTILSVRSREDADAQPSAYWSARDVARCGTENPFEGSAEDAVDALDEVLRDAVGLRMLADVPIGAFLSGGVDSSTVVSLMQAQSDRPVHTFSIGFETASYDEARHARAVAEHLGTHHTELYVTADDALAVIPRLPELFDEPFADSSQVPTYLISALARRHVTVALSGDGGDELFGGYNRHVWASRIWQVAQLLPSPLRHAGVRAVGSLTPESWDRAIGFLERPLPAGLRQAHPGSKVHRVARALASTDVDAMYRSLASQWEHPDRLVLDASEPPTAATAAASVGLAHPTDRMLYLDLVSYLPDDVLTKVDRASMAVSLEARNPLLDHRVVELAWRIPRSMKLRGGRGKWLLRQLLQRHVPAALIERPKVGFAIPLGTWLRGPLRDWASALLDERRIAAEGFLDVAIVRERWTEHLSRRHDHGSQLWNVLMFQAWLERRRDSAGSSGDTAGAVLAGAIP